MSVASLPLKRIPVVLLGFGNVGQSLVTQIQLAAAPHASKYGLRFDIVGVADSSGSVQASTPGEALTQAQLSNLVQIKSRPAGLASHPLGSAASSAELLAAATKRERCI